MVFYAFKKLLSSFVGMKFFAEKELKTKEVFELFKFV